MSTHTNITERMGTNLQHFSEYMEKNTQLKDGFLTARIIGEFSAGKTRLLRELLGNAIPPALFPISSIERQTKLQLEITYGDQAELTLIEREEDYRPAVTLKTLTKFPERNDIDDAYHPARHRLRLALPIQNFILPNGDGMQEEKTPMRLFLIDTPGWNSGDDDIAESEASKIMAGYHNLALVYVTDARRLDGATNTNRLRDFLEVLQNADFLEGAHLLFVVTHCPAEDKNRLEQRAKQHVLDLWSALHNSPSSLTLNILCVDFDEMNAEDLQQFRDDFWQHLLAPLGDQAAPDVHPWMAQIHRWPVEWDFRKKILQTQNILSNVKHLLEHACPDGDFLPGMNMYRLIGLNESEVHKKIQGIWSRQLKCGDSRQIDWNMDAIGLDSQHPLSSWWRDYWIANINTSINPAKEFFKKADQAINGLSPATEDLQLHMQAHLSAAYKNAMTSIDSVFIRLVNVAQVLVDEPSHGKVLATLLTLSVLQARHEDYCALHSQRYQETENA